MIVGVALRSQCGEVVSLPRPNRHIDLQDAYPQHYPDSPPPGWDLGEHGFVDEVGRFYTRAEAARHARSCGQASDKVERLYSEDVW